MNAFGVRSTPKPGPRSGTEKPSRRGAGIFRRPAPRAGRRFRAPLRGARAFPAGRSGEARWGTSAWERLFWLTSVHQRSWCPFVDIPVEMSVSSCSRHQLPTGLPDSCGPGICSWITFVSTHRLNKPPRDAQSRAEPTGPTGTGGTGGRGRVLREMGSFRPAPRAGRRRPANVPRALVLRLRYGLLAQKRSYGSTLTFRRREEGKGAPRRRGSTPARFSSGSETLTRAW